MKRCGEQAKSKTGKLGKVKKRDLQSDRLRREKVMREIVGNAAYDENRIALEQADAVQEAAGFIRQMRNDAKLSQTVLGERIGVSQERISEMERGNSPEGVSYALLRRVARACGLDDWPNAPVQTTADLMKQVYEYELADNSIELVPLVGTPLTKRLGVNEIFTFKKNSHSTAHGEVLDSVTLSVKPTFGSVRVRGISPLKSKRLSLSSHAYVSSKETKA